MKSFKIAINGHAAITLHSFFSHVILTKIDNRYHLLMYGGDEQNNRFAWEAKVLKEGDSIDIQVQDLEAGTAPKVTPAEDLTSLKEEYEHLKPELEKRGLI